MPVLDLQRLPVRETAKKKTLHPGKGGPDRAGSGLSILLCD